MRQDLQLMRGKRVLEVVEAGLHALAQVAKANKAGQPFHALLLNWHMPGMSGLEVAAELRTQEEASGLTTLLKPEAACINGVPTKPVEPEGIARVFKTHTQAVTKSLSYAASMAPAAEPILDLLHGLRRLDGDRALQQRLLHNFTESYLDLIQRLDVLLAKDRAHEAIDLIH